VLSRQSGDRLRCFPLPVGKCFYARFTGIVPRRAYEWVLRASLATGRSSGSERGIREASARVIVVGGMWPWRARCVKDRDRPSSALPRRKTNA
jgi:hypothetical protein